MNTRVTFENVEGLVFVGDVHGEWSTLGYKIDGQYQLENCVVIQLGDFGIGFNSDEYNKIELGKLNKRIKKRNNKLVVLRGNHDDKSYFDGKYSKQYSNISLIPDYTIVELSYQNGHLNILCVGGGVSVDRTLRKEWEEQNRRWSSKGKRYYWDDEMAVYDNEALNMICEEYMNDIHIIASHTSPPFTFPQTKEGILSWCLKDMQLKDDLDIERGTMNKILEHLKPYQSNIKEWYYAHFHCTKSEEIDGIWYRLLDCSEFRERKF